LEPVLVYEDEKRFKEKKKSLGLKVVCLSDASHPNPKRFFKKSPNRKTSSQ
jgi:hypothetical protein